MVQRRTFGLLAARYVIGVLISITTHFAVAAPRCEIVFTQSAPVENIQSVIESIAELHMQVDLARSQGALTMVDKLAAQKLHQKTLELLSMTDGIYTSEQLKEFISQEITRRQNIDIVNREEDLSTRAEQARFIPTQRPQFKEQSSIPIVDVNNKRVLFSISWGVHHLPGTDFIFVDAVGGPQVINIKTGRTYRIHIDNLKLTVLQSNNKLLALDYEGQLMEVDLLNPSVVKLHKYKGDFNSKQASFTPDGKYLSIKNGDTTKTYETRTGKRVFAGFVDPERKPFFQRLFKHPTVGVHEFISNNLLLIHVESGYYLFDIYTGQTRKFNMSLPDIYNLQVLPDGRTLIGAYDKNIYKVDIDDISNFDNKAQIIATYDAGVIRVNQLEDKNTLFVRLAKHTEQNHFLDTRNLMPIVDFDLISESSLDFLASPILIGDKLYAIEYNNLKVYKR